MSEVLEAKFRAASKKISALEIGNQNLEKRIDDLSSLIKTMLTVVSLLFGVFAFAGVLSLQSEKGDLRDYRKQTTNQIEKAIGSLSGLPELSLYNLKHQELDNNILNVKLLKNESEFDLFFFIRNSGGVRTKRLYVSIYFKESIAFERLSADEQDFKYSVGFKPSDFKKDHDIIPVGAAYHYKLGFKPLNGIQHLEGKHPAMIKIYYGGEVPYVARFDMDFGKGAI